MAVQVTHSFVSPVPDNGNPDEVGPNEWNAPHDITGLGTAAEADASDFATAAQGTLADSAVQPGDLAAVATSGAYADLTGTPDPADYATAAQGALADTAVQPADIANMLETSDIGVSVQAYDADLAAWAGVNPSSYSTTAQIAAAYQPLDADLTSWAGVTRASGFDAFAATPSSANLRSLLSDETGTGAAVFADAPTLVNPVVGTQSARDNSTKAASTAYVDGATRELLTADRTYYVRTDGSDSNNGLANTSGGAFLTIQKAWNTIITLDLNGFSAKIKLGNTGTYTSGLTTTIPPVGGLVTIEGDTTTAANTTVSTTFDCINHSAPCTIILDAFRVVSASGYGIAARVQGAIIKLGDNNFNFGACASGHILAQPGVVTYVNANTPYIISGSAARHYHAAQGGVISFNNPQWTLTGTPAFSSAFAVGDGGGILSIFSADVVSGSATGVRYSATLNGVINTFGGGASYFPGNAAGTTATGGQYA